MRHRGEQLMADWRTNRKTKQPFPVGVDQTAEYLRAVEQTRPSYPELENQRYVAEALRLGIPKRDGVVPADNLILRGIVPTEVSGETSERVNFILDHPDALESPLLCWENPDGTLDVANGNHRLATLKQ